MVSGCVSDLGIFGNDELTRLSDGLRTAKLEALGNPCAEKLRTEFVGTKDVDESQCPAPDIRS